MNIEVPRSLTIERSSYIEKLIADVNINLNDIKIKKLIFDFSKTLFVSGELTVLLGILLLNIREKNKEYELINIKDKVLMNFKRNGFWKEFVEDVESVSDYYENTIKLYLEDTRNSQLLDSYLQNEVFNNKNWKDINCNKEIVNSAIQELAVNVLEHSDTNKVLCCGQFYPKKKELHFALADNGISMPVNIRDNLNNGCICNQENDSELINWATKKGTSTKKIPQSGLGLYDIKKNLLLSGELYIISNRGYWRKMNQDTEEYLFDMSYPLKGTFVEFVVKLDDRNEFVSKCQKNVSF